MMSEQEREQTRDAEILKHARINTAMIGDASITQSMSGRFMDDAKFINRATMVRIYSLEAVEMFEKNGGTFPARMAIHTSAIAGHVAPAPNTNLVINESGQIGKAGWENITGVTAEDIRQAIEKPEYVEETDPNPWHYATTDEEPMTDTQSTDILDALQIAMEELGVYEMPDDERPVLYMGRFRPVQLNWKRIATRLLEQIDEDCYEVDGRDRSFITGTDDHALEMLLKAIVKVDAVEGYGAREFAPGDDEYDQALARIER